MIRRLVEKNEILVYIVRTLTCCAYWMMHVLNLRGMKDMGTFIFEVGENDRWNQGWEG